MRYKFRLQCETLTKQGKRQGQGKLIVVQDQQENLVQIKEKEIVKMLKGDDKKHKQKEQGKLMLEESKHKLMQLLLKEKKEKKRQEQTKQEIQ